MWSNAAVEGIVAMAEAGLGASAISRRTGVPRSTVRDWLGGRTPRAHREPNPVVVDPTALPDIYPYLLGL